MKNLFSNKIAVSLFLSFILIIQPFAGISFAAKEKAPQVSFTIDKVINENNYKKFSISGSSKYKADLNFQVVDGEETTLMKNTKTNDKGEFKVDLNLASLVDGKITVKVVAMNKKGINTKSQTITKKIVENVVVVPPVVPETPVVIPPITPEPPVAEEPEPHIVNPETDPVPPITIEPHIVVPPVVEPTPDPEPPVVVEPVEKSFPKGTGASIYYDGENEMNLNKEAGFNIARADM